MRKKFKFKRSKIKILLLLLLVYLIYEAGSYIYLNIKIPKNNEDFLKFVINESDYKKIFESKENNLFNKLFSLIMNIDINEPKTLVSNYSYNDVVLVNKELDKNIYIFNTHPLETYSNSSLEATSITPDIIMTSYLLQDELAELNIGSTVEEVNFYTYMKDNNLPNNSYEVARPFVMKALENSDLDLIIDVHRDSVNYEQGTTVINNKKYAKILFVVGDNNETKEENLALARRINELIPLEYKSITRGIYVKPRCVFNQDLSGKMILLEVGGYQNNMDEVYNTVEIVALAIKEYLDEERR